jgi:hypothetical protein
MALDNIAPTTELEAVNTVLTAAGFAPIDADELQEQTSEDTVTAVGALRRILRGALAKGWRFNARFGVQIAPAGTYDWIDADGVTTTLNIFKRPSASLAFALTRCSENRDLDMVEAISARYTESDAYGTYNRLVLVDRARNRDGAEAQYHPYLYLDTIQAVDFEQSPETFRAYVSATAARTFYRDIHGDDKTGLLRDELMAWTLLQKEQGVKRKVNMFDSAEMQEMLGFRNRSIGTVARRVFPQ